MQVWAAWLEFVDIQVDDIDVAVAKNVQKRPKRRGSQMDAHLFEQIICWLLKAERTQTGLH
jgi:hypothetical protein